MYWPHMLHYCMVSVVAQPIRLSTDYCLSRLLSRICMLRPVYSDATQLNVDLSWVELRRCRHPHRRNSTVADDRQCNWPSWTAYSQSAWSRSVVYLFTFCFPELR